MKSFSKETVDQLIAQLRKSLENIIAENVTFDNEFYLYRWLLHNKMKVEKTEKAIRESIVWRKANNIEELANRDWAFWAPEMRKEIMATIDGFTKNGQPVSSCNGDRLDSRSFFEKYGTESVIRYSIQAYAKHEKLILDHYKHGPRDDSDTLKNENAEIKDNCGDRRSPTGYNPSWYFAAPVHITSFKDFSLSNATFWEGIQAMIKMARIGLSHFPTLVSALYVINLNPFSNVVVKVLKPLIKTECFDLKFFDTDESKWSEELLKIIDSDQLLPCFGGTKPIQN